MIDNRKRSNRQNKPLGRIAMNKETFLKICLFMLMLVFCSYFSSVALAGDCAESESADEVGTPTIPGEFTIAPDWFPEFQYDPANPQTIERNTSITINVINGTPPYTWSVSGTGFSVDTEAEGSSNTLTADDTACGVAEITVTDNDGSSETSAKGYVREEHNSGWVLQPELTNTCPEPGEATQVHNFFTASRVVGKVKIEEKAVRGEGYPWKQRCHTVGYCGGFGSDCNGVCTAVNCSSRGCNECITSEDFLGGDGYGCVVYPWQSSFWCGNNPCCFCVCNSYTKVFYWGCN